MVADGAFDAVAGNFVINHVSAPDVALAELRRVLRRGGRLVAEAGFGEVAVEEVTWEHVVDPEEWWETGALSRVGTNGVIVGRQDAKTVARIKDAYDGIVSAYAAADGQVALPAHALLASAVR